MPKCGKINYSAFIVPDKGVIKFSKYSRHFTVDTSDIDNEGIYNVTILG